MKSPAALAVALVALTLSSCLSLRHVDPQAAFFGELSDLCGRSFAGRVISDDLNDPAFADKRLIIDVRDCSATEVRVPFHVGEDRSRTWVITRTATGLRLKHDHRHADGTPDVLTWYGGDTVNEGTFTRQEFPVDAESIALFQREGREVSTTNDWALVIESDRVLIYELSRPGGRLFRVAFDLSRPVATP